MLREQCFCILLWCLTRITSLFSEDLFLWMLPAKRITTRPASVTYFAKKEDTSIIARGMGWRSVKRVGAIGFFQFLYFFFVGSVASSVSSYMCACCSGLFISVTFRIFPPISTPLQAVYHGLLFGDRFLV